MVIFTVYLPDLAAPSYRGLPVSAKCPLPPSHVLFCLFRHRLHAMCLILPPPECLRTFENLLQQLLQHVFFTETVTTLQEKWQGGKDKFSAAYYYDDDVYACKHPICALVSSVSLVGVTSPTFTSLAKYF